MFRTGHATETKTNQVGGVVKRAVGFVTDFDFVAEVTVQTADGLVTTREKGHTVEGAAKRALLAARDRAMFVNVEKRLGFA